jgi:hypothetical protein
MKHQVTVQTRSHVEALGEIRLRVQPRLDRVSPAAREEWVALLMRLPSPVDVAGGVTEVSPETLAEMVSKARRFEQILRSAVGPAAGPVQQ